MNNNGLTRVRLALFASGNGTNVQQICEHFTNHPYVEVACIIYNRRDAFVAERARLLGIESKYFTNSQIRNCDEVIAYLVARSVDYIILAGFLALMPSSLLEHFPHSVINIHPALLPKYGGKGMYGHHVHEAVVAAHEQVSGITVHLVNEHYDDGDILFQASCMLSAEDDAESVAHKIHLLEKKYFPMVIESFVLGLPMPNIS